MNRRTKVLLLLWSAVSACSDPTGTSGDDLVLWAVPSQNAETSPLILDDLVVFGTADGAVLALDRESGDVTWKHRLPAAIMNGDEIEFAGGTILVPQYRLWGLDPASGEVRWMYAGSDGAAGVRRPAISGDTVYTASHLGHASAVDGRTGLPYWETDLGESAFPPAVAGELVVYGTRGYLGGGRQGPLGAGHLVALRRDDGTEAWRVALPDSVGFLGSGGALTGGVVWEDRVVLGTVAAWVLAVRLSDGAILWARPNGGPSNKSFYSLEPTVVDDVVVLGRSDHVWEGWNPSTGERLWQIQSPAQLTPPRAAGSLFYAMAGPLIIGNAEGQILWRGGGMSTYGGHSYYRGSVAPDGTVYCLVLEHFLEGGEIKITALRPSVRP